MSNITSLAAGFILLASAAQAASFPCEKASTPTEKAICADKAVSALDGKLAQAYRAALKALSGNGPDENDSMAAAKADQRGWLGERNACGADAACLQTAYERRLAVLSFRPDPAKAAAVDRFVGTFHQEDYFSVAILGLRDGRVAFTAAGAEPTSARWLCEFSGVGRVGSDGRLIVGTPGAEGEGLIVGLQGDGIAVPVTEENQAASTYCGNGGSFIGTYERRR